MGKKVEIHLVIDIDGLRSVQIIGPPEVHPEGHDLYFSIRDLVLDFDKIIQRRFEQKRNDDEIEKGNEH